MEIRKIEGAEKAEQKRKRNMIILSVIMVAILFFSTIGFFAGEGDENSSEFEEGKIEQIGDEWILRYGEQMFRFSNSPESAKNVSIEGDYKLEDYYGKSIYISSDNDAAAYEITLNLGRYLERIQPACYGQCEKNLPEKNCSESMIVFKNAEENKIYKNESCIFIEGNLESADAFLYKLLRII
ncbi:MAG: hypothetical protein QW666_04220 [Candidatus Woesearchaeota archaeon]